MPIDVYARGRVQAHQLVDVPLPARAEHEHDQAEQRPGHGQHLPGAAAEAGRQAALGQLRDEPGDRDTRAVADRRGDAGDQALQHPAPRQQGRRERGAAEEERRRACRSRCSAAATAATGAGAVRPPAVGRRAAARATSAPARGGVVVGLRRHARLRSSDDRR